MISYPKKDVVNSAVVNSSVVAVKFFVNLVDAVVVYSFEVVSVISRGYVVLMVLLSVPLVVMSVIGVIGKAVGKECVLLSVVSLCVSIVVFVVGVVVSDGVTITVVSLVVVSVVVISVVVVASVVVNDGDGDGGAKDVKDEEEGRREEEENGLNDVVDGVDSDGFDGGFVPIEDDGLLISNGHWSPLEAEI